MQGKDFTVLLPFANWLSHIQLGLTPVARPIYNKESSFLFPADTADISRRNYTYQHAETAAEKIATRNEVL